MAQTLKAPPRYKLFVHLEALISCFIHQIDERSVIKVNVNPPWDEASDERQFFTSNFVLDAFFTSLARIGGYPYAAEQAKLILNSTKLQILWPSHDNELEAVDFFKKYHYPRSAHKFS